MKYTQAGLILTVTLLSSGSLFSQSTINQDDLVKIASLRPTTYYTASESQTKCSGKYGRTSYNGRERQDLLSPEGKYIATVCKRFASVLLMEGSGILKDRGAGPINLNYVKKIRGVPRYRIMGRCEYGIGVRSDLCLLPYHTLAADTKRHKVNSVIYIPNAVGIKLPDGSIHDGTFIVRDTGGAFINVGSERVDMFTGTAPDYNNVFIKAGFSRKKPLRAYLVTGPSEDRVKDKLKAKFGDLY